MGIALLLIVIAILAYVLHLLKHRQQVMKTWESQGVPGPKPHVIFGNLMQMRESGDSVSLQTKWMKEHGTTYGYFFGSRPTLWSTDVNLLKLVQIKDADKFINRAQVIKGGLIPNPVLYHEVIRAKGPEWKRQRSILTPTFSSAKLKGMVPIMEKSIDEMIEVIEEKRQEGCEEFDMYERFQGLTMDIIGRCAFGLQTAVQRDPNDPFLAASKKVFDQKVRGGLLTLIICFPGIEPFVHPFRRAAEWFREIRGLSFINTLLDLCRHAVNQRLREFKSNPKKAVKRADLLQLMLDANISSHEVTNMSDLTISSDMAEEHSSSDIAKSTNGHSEDKKALMRHLTENEVLANAFLFYEAGYETTSTALGFIAHVLINNQDIQEKMRTEIRDLLASEGKLDFNTVTQLEYMECVLYETLRMWPPVTGVVTREALTDYQYEKIIIPKGSTIQVPILQLHYDPQYWPSPEKFDPERFTRGNRRNIDPIVWQPFGAGPRNCIGMRFAILEIKLALAKLLLKYRLEPCGKTERGELTIQPKVISRTPKYGVWANLMPV